MSARALVQIVGAPVACAEGVQDTWRDLAGWAAEKLTARFGAQVEVCYFDLFDPGCPPLPPGAQLPLVFVNGEVLSSGGKISVPAIRKRLEAQGLTYRSLRYKLNSAWLADAPRGRILRLRQAPGFSGNLSDLCRDQ